MQVTTTKELHLRFGYRSQSGSGYASRGHPWPPEAILASAHLVEIDRALMVPKLLTGHFNLVPLPHQVVDQD